MNLDIEDHFFQVASQSRFVDYLKLELGVDKGYVFVDEVQLKEDAGKFFKGLYDMRLPYKFILTGSGSVELKEKMSESLAGRKQLFMMKPVSFIEFLDFKTGYKYSSRLTDFIIGQDPRLESLFQEYLHFGGYPRVILADTLERKREEMQEIYTSYLEKDISKLLNVQKTEAFGLLLTMLASQIGQGINVHELSGTLGLDFATVKNYLWYLEKTFITQICRPYHTNPRSELTKTPLYYFLDLGMRNYALNRFRNLNLALEGGHLFENFIFNFLYDKYEALDPTVNYWRTKDGSEVDFIFRVGTDLLAIEAKYKDFSTPKIGRAVYNFVEKYSPHKVYIVNRTLDEQIAVGDSKILFKAYPRFLVEQLGF